MDRKDFEEYNEQRRETNLILKSDRSLDERIVGIQAIKDVINPKMSMATFYKRHRQHMDYILFIDQDAWRTNRPRYFSFRRLIYHYLLKRRVV
jgi:hypothetical protein